MLVLPVVAPLSLAQEEPPLLDDPAFAEEPGLSGDPIAPEAKIEIGYGRTDNLNRDENELESDIGRLAVGFAGRTERPRLRAGLAGDVEYRKYLADEISEEDDDEVLGAIDAELELHAVPDQIQWDFRFAYGQVRIDPFGAISPSNRQRTTAWTTGPQFNLPLGERTILLAGGVYSEQTFEVTEDLDSEFAAAHLGLARQIDVVTQLALVLERSDTEYDFGGQDYEIGTLSLEYKRQLASGEAFLSIGRGRVEIEGDSQPVTVAQLVWKRDVGVRSRIEICAGREITDAASVFAEAGAAVACPGDASSMVNAARTSNSRTDEVISTTGPLERTGGSLSLLVDGAQGDFRATVSMAQDRFEEQATYDNDSASFDITGIRDFGRHWRAELTGRIWVQDFTDLDEVNEDRFARFALSRLFGRGMRVTLSVDHIRRVDGVSPFEANEIFLSFGRDFSR